VIHADNARPHCAKTVALFFDHNSLRRASHPPYSPDMVLSDFWLFGYLKGVLQGSSFDERYEPDELDEPDDLDELDEFDEFDESDELLFAIQEILSGIDRKTFDAVFQEWMIGLQNIMIEIVNILSDVE
jgi:hypothetical protein